MDHAEPWLKQTTFLVLPIYWKMFPVHFLVRVPQLYLRISVLLSMLCSPMGLSPVLPQSIFLNTLLLRWQYRFNFSSSLPLWFSAPLGLFAGNCPYFLLSSDMLWIGCLWEVIQHSLVDFAMVHVKSLFQSLLWNWSSAVFHFYFAQFWSSYTKKKSAIPLCFQICCQTHVCIDL